MVYKLASKEHTYVTDRRAALLDFVARFVAETGYGATVDWACLNLRLDSPVQPQAMRDDLNLLAQRGHLTRRRIRSGKAMTNYYYPKETHA